MKKLLTSAAWLLIHLSLFSVSAKTESLTSPDGKLVCSVSDTDGIRISLNHDGNPILDESPVALNIRGGRAASKIKSVKKSGNEMTLRLDNGNDIQIRIFDKGAAYRFITSQKNDIIIDNEIAEFNLAGDPSLYLSLSTNPSNPGAMAFQNFYRVTPASSASPLLAFPPATADFGDGMKLTILESDLEAYPGLFLQADSTSRSLKAVFSKYPRTTDFYPRRKQEHVTSTEDFIAKTDGKRSFPWRILAVTTDDRDMPTLDLVSRLASPSRVADTSWIKPGKAAWEWWNDWGLRNVPFRAGINNDTYKYFIDFAAANGIEYVVLDEGWYAPKSGDMLTTIPEIDLPMLTAYAKEKGVGLWLWTVFNVLDSQLEEACKKYSGMGIKGFKVDFLDRNDQTAVEMTSRIAEAAARHRLMLDLHGFYTPTGLEHTYPNILNYESVFGMEEMKWSDPSVDMPEYDVTFPFIRMMAGPVDFTPGAMRNASKSDWKAVYSAPMSQGTRCHQIAHYIVHDSPFSMLADAPTMYLENQPCTDFITSLPPAFDETRILDGKMGEYIVTMRRKGDNYYVAGETDWNPRDYTLDLSFLPAGRQYTATLMRDGVNADRQASDYAVETLSVDSSSSLPVHLAPGGGFALFLKPVMP